jgi:ABC-type antimicrobial peptide transport system permease subunit
METLLGRRDDALATMRLKVRAVVPAEGLGGLGLAPTARTPRNAFVSLNDIQQLLRKSGRVNALLVGNRGSRRASSHGSALDATRLQGVLDDHATLEDAEVRVRLDDVRNYLAVESGRFLLHPAVERAARTAAERIGTESAAVLTYLANEIRLESPSAEAPAVNLSIKATEANIARRSIPYSTVSAIEPLPSTQAQFFPSEGMELRTIQEGKIVLNRWAADELGARLGDRITLTYYVTAEFGRLGTQETSFSLAGVVELVGAAADPGFTPEYPGLTDAATMTKWDPPFPIDLKKVLDRDEAYWEQHRTTPKAFIPLADGQTIWARAPDRFGRVTSIRVGTAPQRTLEETAVLFSEELRKELDFAELGLRFEPVRARALAAAEGTTDFGSLFLGFSFFLIVSSLLLVALLFRLHVDRRGAEVGLLVAVGFAPRSILGLLLAEGATVAAWGSGLGLIGAFGYAWVMTAGPGASWSRAIGVSSVPLAASFTAAGIGVAAGFLASIVAIGVSVWQMTRRTARSLLARDGIKVEKSKSQKVEKEPCHENLGAAGVSPRIISLRLLGRRIPKAPVFIALVAAVAGAGALLALWVIGSASETFSFFAAGVMFLAAGMALVYALVRRTPKEAAYRTGFSALGGLGMRNASRHPGRSFLTAAMIASATFLITALEAFRIDVAPDAPSAASATGGFSVWAESAVPLPFDPNTADGRESLNIGDEARRALEGVTLMPFRLRAGDETSCLNPFRPGQPRLLGAARAMMERGGFAFAGSLAASPQERANPWLLLERTWDDGAISVIGDEAAVKWQLHRGLGEDWTITDERGRPVCLRFVALLRGSVLQGELIVSESDFLTLFPSSSGYSFFLIETPRGSNVASVSETLERSLSDFGFDAGSTAARLADYARVQNAYISAFQVLGGLGLLLGVIGLSAVLLRNVWERRGELALLRAVGYTAREVGVVVLAENAALVGAGVLMGVLPALLAVAPHLPGRLDQISWAGFGLTVIGVPVVGLGASLVALLLANREPLLPALRSE